MPMLYELVEADPKAERKFRSPRYVYELGVAPEPFSREPVLWWFEEGEPLLMVSDRELRGMLAETVADWTVSNR